MNSDEIIKMMEKAKELGVYELECDGMKISFTPKKKPQNAKSKDHELVKEMVSNSVEEFDPSELVKPPDPFETITDEELLFLATPYYHELQVKKAAHQAKINEKVD